jgi:hypothetical protein
MKDRGNVMVMSSARVLVEEAQKMGLVAEITDRYYDYGRVKISDQSGKVLLHSGCAAVTRNFLHDYRPGR